MPGFRAVSGRKRSLFPSTFTFPGTRGSSARALEALAGSIFSLKTMVMGPSGAISSPGRGDILTTTGGMAGCCAAGTAVGADVGACTPDTPGVGEGAAGAGGLHPARTLPSAITARITATNNTDDLHLNIVRSLLLCCAGRRPQRRPGITQGTLAFLDKTSRAYGLFRAFVIRTKTHETSNLFDAILT